MRFKMDFKKLPRCGAKARSNFGKPCRQAAMKNGRCYYHGGAIPIKHGRNTKQAKAERAQSRRLISEIRKSHSALKYLIDDKGDKHVSC
ncbi:MAG: hypothetical protein K2X90_00205 [Candidatus Babeliaceae bacterium]|nr:hypothetical protein [Candidatus Babeliaceae bacterium]